MVDSSWAFTKDPLTKVYNYTKKYAKDNNKRRKVVANLLMGEWVKPLQKYGKYYRVAFRGGVGFLPESALTDKRLLELYFIDVGQGDSILVQTPKDRRLLIDSGRDNKAHSFLKWKYNLIKKTNEIEFDALIMTHPDQDHAKGFNYVLSDPQIAVKAVYHNGIVRFKNNKIGKITGKGKNRKLVELYDDMTAMGKENLSRDYVTFVSSITKARGKNPNLVVKRLDQFAKKLDGFDELNIKVLGPINEGTKQNPEYRAIDTNSIILNGNSVSLMLEYRECKILLCGDMNTPYETEFLKIYSGSKLRAHVFKANHHGSQDFTEEFLSAVQPWASVVSSGDEPDYGHPSAVLLGSLGRYAPPKIKRPLVFSTEIAATFKEIKDKEFKKISTKTVPIYEKTIKGIVHVRTDGRKLVLGRIYGNPTLADPDNHNGYQWECYLFDLKDESGKCFKCN